MIATLQRWPGLITAASRALTTASVIVLIGALPWLSGADPARTILRARSAEQEATPEALAAIREQLGLDAGPVTMFGRWLGGLLRGDAGVSWVSGRPVLPGMLTALGVSLTLMVFAALVAILVAGLMCVPTVRRGLAGRDARTSGMGAVALTALPEFLLATALLVVVAVGLGWLPPYGWEGLEYAILPALAMGLPAGGLMGRLLADGLATTFAEPWVVTWQVAGYSSFAIALAAVRRTLPSITSQLALTLVGLLGGAVAVERVFAIPGLGRATLGAAVAQDLPTLQVGILLLMVIALLLGGLGALARRWLLGPALAAGQLPASTPRSASGWTAWIVPGTMTLLLIGLVVSGIGRDPYASTLPRLAPPSAVAPLGADASGRDLLARVSHGVVTTVTAAVVVVLVCLLIGLLVGLVPRIGAGPIEVTNAMPPVIAGLLVAAVVGGSLVGAAIAVALTCWAPLAAHTAALAEETRGQPHVRIAPVLGVGTASVLLAYVLPAVIGPVTRHAMLRLPGIALAIAGLGFLGLGPQPPQPEWGLILGEGMPYVERAPWAVLAPTLALIALSILAVSTANLAPRTRNTSLA
ncbi:MAG: ABC transporter permease subunit [Microlunatus sp.]